MSAAVGWVAFADDESGEVICRARTFNPSRNLPPFRDAATLAEAVQYANEHVTEFDTAKPRIFKRPADPQDPHRPIGRAA